MGSSSDSPKPHRAPHRALHEWTVEQHIEEHRRLLDRNHKLQRELTEIKRINDTAEDMRREIYKLADIDINPPRWLFPDADKMTPGSPGIPCMIWSDWHYGEVVKGREVGGMNEFNKDVAQARIKRLVAKSADIAINHMGRRRHQYQGAVICLGGDMIGGDIHEELAATNDRTAHESIEDLTSMIAGALDEMATRFGQLFVPCVVGNHGRSTKKPRMKGRVHTSFEWNIYCNLERHFKKSRAIRFLIPGESDAYFQVCGHRYLLTHGDSLGVKGGDGIIGAMGPIMRGAIKLGRSEAQIGRDFDTLIMGHWHQYLTFPGVIVNNSLKGYDEYARLALRAPYSRPSQALWFTHPRQGVTAHWQIYLEDLRSADSNQEIVTWEKKDV